MKTAQEILKGVAERSEYVTYADIVENCKEETIAAMILYAKEAIEECAERAKSGWVRYGEKMGHEVEKRSILNLIDELK